MKKVLLFGSGRSSPAIIAFLSEWAVKGVLSVKIADLAAGSSQSFPSAQFIETNIHNEAERQTLIRESDIVVSLLPPALHLLIATDCLRFSKHFITASYVSPEIQALDQEAKAKGLLFLMECGLDPGIDHLSAMKEIHDIKEKGGKITSFKSYTGGLIAPESDNNPWNYKITWNPRNVVLAGQGTVKYLENGQFKYIPYHRLFANPETIRINGLGNFEAYANRDSLKYIQTYTLEDTATFLRGTLRKPGFCAAWNLLVQLGITDDSYRLENSEDLTWEEVTHSFLKPKNDKKVNHLLAALLHKGAGAREIYKLKWLGLLDKKKTGLKNATPAELLQQLLQEKLVLMPEDKDMIVMQHEFDYQLNGASHKRIVSLVLKGEDKINTAMAKTVGLPLGIAALMIVEGKLTLTGVQIPVTKEIYEPMLEELEKHGIVFEVFNY